MAGADLRAALVASCLRGAFPPVDLRAVCLVRAMFAMCVETKVIRFVRTVQVVAKKKHSFYRAQWYERYDGFEIMVFDTRF